MKWAAVFAIATLWAMLSMVVFDIYEVKNRLTILENHVSKEEIKNGHKE